MIGQLDNKVSSSVLLWLDNKILTKGRAFTNVSSSFHKVSGLYANYTAYGNPYGQMVYDSSISGANVITGAYVNNNFVHTGQSGIIGINYDKGHIYINGSNSLSLSGDYAVKDFSIVLTDDQEETLLFKNKYYLKSRLPQTPSGIPQNYIPYPVIFVKNDGGYNKPFTLGGLEQTFIDVRCIVFTDNLFSLHAAQSILRDSVRTPIALFEPEELPFNSVGGLKSGVFNYTGIANVKINEQKFLFIENVSIPSFKQKFASNINDINNDVYFNFVDLELVYFGNPRER